MIFSNEKNVFWAHKRKQIVASVQKKRSPLWPMELWDWSVFIFISIFNKKFIAHYIAYYWLLHCHCWKFFGFLSKITKLRRPVAKHQRPSILTSSYLAKKVMNISISADKQEHLQVTDFSANIWKHPNDYFLSKLFGQISLKEQIQVEYFCLDQL